MSKLEDTIKEVQGELSESLGMSKSEYLAFCASQKISERSQMYSDDFDRFLSHLESNELYRNDMSRLADSLVSLSSLVSASYDSLIKMINDCEKNIFRNKT